MKSKLVLASASPRRKELLSNLGFKFEIIKPGIDEIVFDNETPKGFVKRIASEKAEKVRSLVDENTTVIAADTIVVIDNKILGKPEDNKDAEKMLERLSGNSHLVFTGFAISNFGKSVLHVEVVETEVKFKELNSKEVQGYIATGEHSDKAGAYAIQGIGSFMIKSINGSYTNVVGLPLSELVNALTRYELVKIFD